MSLFIGISFIHADSVQKVDKLEVEKQALLLELETYALKKKIIEMQNFIKGHKLKKEKKREREKALKRLKDDLKSSRKKARSLRLANVK